MTSRQEEVVHNHGSSILNPNPNPNPKPNPNPNPDLEAVPQLILA